MSPSAAIPEEDRFDCTVCGDAYPRSDLDRMLWCDRCKVRASQRARSLSWWVGALVAAVLAVWIFLLVQPTVIVGGWIGVVLGGFWVGARVSREVLYATFRSRWGS
jgi:predicted nucleic acid-binding Zn ribbon protein